MKVILVGNLQDGLLMKVRDNTAAGATLPIDIFRTIRVFGRGSALIGKKVTLTVGPTPCKLKREIKFVYMERIIVLRGNIDQFDCIEIIS